MKHRIGRFLSVSLMGLCAAASAHALYKVVGPDGKITYTDRPPASGGTAAPVGAGDGTSAAQSPLPLEVRQAAARYPVTLYVTPQDCAACDSGRNLLRNRGIPFAERQIITREDIEALRRITGLATAPVLTVGSQVLQGLSSELWNQYLDAAGYPKESRLPATYVPPRARPLTEQREVVRPTAPTPAPAPPPAPVAPPPAAGTGGIRF